MRVRSGAVFVLLAAGCGPRFGDAPADWVGDAGSIDEGDGASDPCRAPDLANPPLSCERELVSCGEESVTCSTETPCGAPTRQLYPELSHRIARLRFWAPERIVALAGAFVDPRVEPRCIRSGSEQISWLLYIDPERRVVATGAARPSGDGVTFAFTTETIDPLGYAKMCPGFVGPKAPIRIAPVAVAFDPVGETGFTTAWIPSLPLVVFDPSTPWVLPLREVRFRVPEITSVGSCIGSFARNEWCAPRSLGWTAGGTIDAKLTLEDADRIPVQAAGCQSLCALLAPDPTKVEGRVCRRDREGNIPEWGDACAGDAGCHNAFGVTATFASHGVTITP